MERPTPTPRAGLPIGRAALLGTFAAGVGGIAVAPAREPLALQRRAARTRRARPTCCRASEAAGASTACSPRCPRFDPNTFELQHHRPRREAAATALERRRGAAGRASDERLPLRHRLVGRQRALGGHPAADDHRPRAARRPRRSSSRCSRWRRRTSTRSPSTSSASPTRCSPGTGRQAADALARRAAAARAAEHVRLQERQVGARAALRRDSRPGYWEQRGYDVDAWVGKSNGYG